MKVYDRVARRSRSRSGNRRSVPLGFDLFEDRLLLATFTVNSTGDAGTGTGTSGTLRYVISLVNAASTASTIDFAIGSGPQTITLASDLTPIVKPVNIDGYSETGAAPNTTTIGTNAVILIQLNLNGHQGLVFNPGSKNSEVSGLSIFGGNSFAGVTIDESDVAVTGDFLGVQADGKTVSASAEGVSVEAASGLTGVKIGSPLAADRNLISGNTNSGISAAGPALIEGNLIGSDATGALVRPNGEGIAITGSGVTVGGTVTGAGNTIAFNTGPAVNVDTGTNNPIQQNQIFDNGVDIGHSGIVLANGGNSNEPAPTISGVTSITGRTSLQGSLQGTGSGNHTYTIEFYASLPGDAIGTQVQAHYLVGNTTLSIIGTAAKSFFLQLPTTVLAGQVVVATATSDMGNTSEFSSNAALSNPFVVTTTADDGVGSLREAIKNANANPGMDTISFDIPNAPYTISLGSGLPAITDPVLLDGTSQPGYIGAPVIQLDGHTHTVSGDGLKLDTSSNTSRVRGLDIYGFASGAAIDVVSNHDVIQGNYLGTDVTGTMAATASLEGILINGATDTQVGGLSSVGNLISANVAGVVIKGSATGSMLQGNLIGTDITGKAGLPNTSDGVQVSASNNTIGGSVAAVGNVIAYNGAAGVNVISGTGDVIRMNSIFANTTSGILLGTGANDNQPAPTISSVNSAGGTTTIQGSLTGFTHNDTFVLEFFASASGDPSGGDQAHVFLGTDTVTTDGSGKYTIAEKFNVGVGTGQRVTATATSGSAAANPNDTSIFAASVVVANPFQVTNTNTSGPGSLEQAILNANANPGSTPDAITFNIPGTGPFTINVSTALTNITVPVLLDGTTEPGYSGTPLIQIQGNSSAGDGLVLAGASGGSTIRGLDLYGFSGGAGIHIETNGNAVQSTYLGTNATGTATGLGNQAGLWIDNAGSNTTGGSSLGNLISGNGIGVLIAGSKALQNVLVGNQIGTDVTGKVGLHNSGDGVQISASDNTVGGTATGAANIIAFNTGAGVDVKSGTGDAIRQNSIFANASGITLVSGANNNQPSPAITSVNSAGSSTTIVGSLTGFTHNNTFVLEFFASAAGDPTGEGQAHLFLGSTSVTTDGSGNASFTENSKEGVAAGQRVTATATSPTGDTSIFATSVVVANPFSVTNINNSGAGSLEQAILNANANPGSTPDAITFNISGTGPFTINVSTALTNITVPVLLDGTTEPGYSGTPLIQIQGNSSAGDGLVLAGASGGSTIRGLDMYGFSGGAGIHIETNGNAVQSTYLGTNATGTATGLGNQAGLWIDNAGSNTIGSTTLGNLISGNATGVLITGTSATNVVLGNQIGTDLTGAAALANTSDGVQISASDNTIGGTASGAANIIAYNGTNGVEVISGTGDTMTQNSIFANTGSGIALGSGANNHQKSPALTGATSIAGQTTVQGNLSGFTPGTSFVLEFFASVAGDPSGGDQAHVYLGSSKPILTDGGGNAPFTETFNMAVSGGQRVTATATSPTGDTSAFASSVTVANPFLVTNTKDTGLGSLNQAIQNADANPGSTPDVISFKIPGAGPFTIMLMTPLPPITVPVTIDGTSQTGITITPRSGFSINDGLVLDTTSPGSSGSTIQGLTISGFSNDGILVKSDHNTIGGTTAGAANVISGPGGDGVVVDAGTGNQILRNLITNVNQGIVLNNGGNDNQAAPTNLAVTSVASLTTVSFTFNATTTDPYIVQFFASSADGLQAPASLFLFQTTITPQAIGTATYTTTFTAALQSPQTVTATATSSTGNTSAFASSASLTDPFQVTNTADFGVGSLRQVILNADQVTTQQTITFTIPTSDPGYRAGFWTITPASSLPAITNSVVFDMSSQTDYVNTPVIEIVGTQVNGDGLVLGSNTAPKSSSAGSTILGLDLSGFGSGAAIHIETGGNKVLQTILGIDLTGKSVAGNSVGILLDGDAGNTIGGTASVAANTIGSNSTAGIQLLGSSTARNVVEGNLIGTDASGQPHLNGIGIQIKTANNLIGGITQGTANTIGFSGTAGVQLSGAAATGNLIEGNFIGTNGSLTSNLGNTIGVLVIGGVNNSIGGTAAGAANTIGYSAQNGVSVLSGIQNLIRANFYLGNNTGQSSPANDILLGPGANNNQPAPVLIAGAVSKSVLDLRINFGGSTVPDALDLYLDNTTAAQPSRVFLGTASVTRDGASNEGEVTLALPGTVSVGPGSLIVATATVAANGTSVFSAPVSVANFFTVTTNEDHGTGSLRTVIGNAETVAVSNPQPLMFKIPGAGPFTIALATALPPITVPVILDATSEPGYAGAPLIQLDGKGIPTSSGPIVDGLVLAAGSSKSTIKGVVVTSFAKGAGIHIESSNNTVAATYLGTDLTGTKSGSGNLYGLQIDGSSGNTIGGADASMLNLISGNTGDGIFIENGSSSNIIESSLIGTDITGKLPVPNVADGILLQGSSGNSIGAPYNATGNGNGTLLLISGNTGNGVEIKSQSNGNVIQNAYIGTDLTGSTALANTNDGVLIDGSSRNSVGAAYGANVNNTLNVISANLGNGVEITNQSASNQVENSDIGVTFTNLIGSGKTNGNGKDGVLIFDSQNNAVGGAGSNALNVISGNKASGVHITGTITGTAGQGKPSTGNGVINSFIGTDPTGSFSNQSFQNASYGVVVNGTASQNAIGATVSIVSTKLSILGYDRNVISGNANGGVFVESGGNLVVANIIGADVTGLLAIPNLGDGIHPALGDGIALASGGNSIGATTSAAVLGTSNTITGGNRITGNEEFGLYVSNNSVSSIVANTIGATTNNGAFNQKGGILLADAANQIIGGSFQASADGSVAALDASRNLIVGNGGQGILIAYSNGSATGGKNTIEGNQVSRNSLDGILLTGTLPTGAGNDQILANFIGTDVTGNTTFDSASNLAQGNGLNGVELQGIAANIQGDLISGNGLSGISVGRTILAPLAYSDLSGTTIAGNKLGTNLAGTSVVAIEGSTNAALPMGNILDGILLDHVVGVQVGTAQAGSPNIGGVSILNHSLTGANLISGNLGRGIEIQGVQSSISSISNTIQYNVIGTDLSGKNATGLPSNAASGSVFNLGNLSDGIFLFDAPGTLIENNLVSNNRGAGIHAKQEDIKLASGSLLITQNLIGTGNTGDFTQDSSGNTLGNSSDGIFLDNVGGSVPSADISQNVISGNRANGIDLLQTQNVAVTQNAIGTGVAGEETGLGNAASGVFLNQASDNTIGAAPQTVTGGWLNFSLNIISGNSASGILISGNLTTGKDATGNLVIGNDVGLDGHGTTALPNSVSGIVISGATGNIIGEPAVGLGNAISGNQLNGIQLASVANGNMIQGNLIGTNAQGTAAVGNTAEGVLLVQVSGNMVWDNTISGNDANGVRIFGAGSTLNRVYANAIGLGAPGKGVDAIANLGNGVLMDNAGSNTIGGSTAAFRNTISGNLQSGVFLLSSTGTGNSQVAGNFIGTSADGAHAVPNGGNGVFIDGSLSNMIGGLTSTAGKGLGNVISGNAQAGVAIFSPASTAPARLNIVAGNLIGTDANGTQKLGNGSDGVQIINGEQNTIGLPGDLNVISGNASNGVFIDAFPGRSATLNLLAGNDIGTDVSGTLPLGNLESGVLVNDATLNFIGWDGWPGETVIASTNVPVTPSNVISANVGPGVQFTGTAASNSVLGSYIGVAGSGLVVPSLGNPIGVYLNHTSQNTVGGTAIGAGNIVAEGKLGAQAGSSLIGIEIQGTGNDGQNTILGNVIGIDRNQNTAADSVGVLVTDSSGNTIGGPSPAAKNIISGNSLAGIEITGEFSVNNHAAGNFIGTNFDGSDRPGSPDTPTPQPNLPSTQESGVLLDGVSGNTIGGASDSDPSANVISGNTFGVQITGAGTAQAQSSPAQGANAVSGNKIGTSASGLAAVPNFELGVYVLNSPGNGISGNLISGNGIGGVELFGEQTTKTSISSNTIGGNANAAPAFVGTSSTKSFVTSSGITVYYGLQEHGVVVVGSSNNLIGTNGGNRIVGNIETGVYLANRDFAGIVYAAPVNNKVQNNAIRTNGIYGVLRYNAPNNPVVTTGATRNVFSGDPVTISDYISAVNSQSPQPPPTSTLLPPGSSGSSSSQAGTGTGSAGPTPGGLKKSHQPKKHPKTSHQATPKRPRVPALFPKGSNHKVVTHKPSGPQVRPH